MSDISTYVQKLIIEVEFVELGDDRGSIESTNISGYKHT